MGGWLAGIYEPLAWRSRSNRAFKRKVHLGGKKEKKRKEEEGGQDGRRLVALKANLECQSPGNNDGVRLEESSHIPEPEGPHRTRDKGRPGDKSWLVHSRTWRGERQPSDGNQHSCGSTWAHACCDFDLGICIYLYIYLSIFFFGGLILAGCDNLPLR